MKKLEGNPAESAFSRVRPHPGAAPPRPKMNPPRPQMGPPEPQMGSAKPIWAACIRRRYPPPSVPASNSPAHSNSPAPATPRPSVCCPADTPLATPRSSSGLYFPHPDPSCSSRTQPKSRQPVWPRKQQFEETFFLSSTKTDVVINCSPNTQDMEDFSLTPLHLALSLQLRIRNPRKPGAS